MIQSLSNIPTHFNGNWRGVDFSRPASLFRSVDWIETFLYCAPCIISPRFKKRETTIKVNKLIRGCLLAVQWELSTEDLEEIERHVSIYWNKYFYHLRQLID
jgi:hypothetical protein